MHLILLLVLANPQAPAKPPINLLAHHGSTPTVSQPANAEGRPSVRLSLPHPYPTTPNLSLDSDIQTHMQIERDLGGQIEAMYDLKSKVSTLETDREKIDRPDIDGLKESRNHIVWTWGILVTIFGTIFGTIFFLASKFYNVIWADSIKPRLRKALIDPDLSELSKQR
jgi:hypothetical protein